MKKKSVLLIMAKALVFSFFALVQDASAATYYVSPTGNDTTGNGSLNNPWKTIQRAANAAVAGDTILIRAGTYRETVTPANNGVTFQNYNGEAVTVSGADLVAGWSLHTGSIYKATVSGPLLHGGQVFVDGQMMVQARWPNTAPANLMTPAVGLTDASTTPTLIIDSALPSTPNLANAKV